VLSDVVLLVGVQGFMELARNELAGEFGLRRKCAFFPEFPLERVQMPIYVVPVEFQGLGIDLGVCLELDGRKHLPNVVVHLRIFEERVVRLHHFGEGRIDDAPSALCDFLCEGEGERSPEVALREPAVVFVKLLDASKTAARGAQRSLFVNRQLSS
jgi:hypothetical protein